MTVDPVTNPAANAAALRHRALDRMMLLLALAFGLAVASVDARPDWNDTGISAGLLFLGAGLVACIAPRRVWRWALAVGLWIPLYLFIRTPTLIGLASDLPIFCIPLAGAYGGRLLRRAVVPR